MLAVAYATGRASHARQVKGDDPDKKGYPGPPGWGFGVGLTTPHSKKKLIVMKVEQRKQLDGFIVGGQKRTKYTEITLATWKVQTMLKSGRDKTQGKTQERMERRSRKRSSSARSEKMERLGDR
jgi:hypothetical protein